MKRAILLSLCAALICAACAAPRASGVPPDRITVNGATLTYDLAGSGPALVLLGGGGMDHRQWDALVPDLSRHFRVLRFDPRGWGQSTPPGQPYSNVEDLRALLDQLQIPQAHVVGLSFGGGLALDFALEHPARVRALVLIAPALGGYRWSESFLQRERGLFGATDSARTERLLQDPHFIPTARRDPVLRQRARTLLKENAHLFDAQLSLARRLDPPALERLAEIRAPVLVLTPELDHPDLFAIAEILERGVAGAETGVLPDVGHMPHMETPEQLRKRLLRFLQRH